MSPASAYHLVAEHYTPLFAERAALVDLWVSNFANPASIDADVARGALSLLPDNLQVLLDSIEGHRLLSATIEATLLIDTGALSAPTKH